MTVATDIDIRWLIRMDYPQVMAIELKSFQYAWTEDDFLAVLAQRNAIGMVAESREQVLGFMVYELLKSQLHVLNFAVHPDHRREGVGTALVQKLIAKLVSMTLVGQPQ